jgi:hypothetical protein
VAIKAKVITLLPQEEFIVTGMWGMAGYAFAFFYRGMNRNFFTYPQLFRGMAGIAQRGPRFFKRPYSYLSMAIMAYFAVFFEYRTMDIRFFEIIKFLAMAVQACFGSETSLRSGRTFSAT